MLGAATQASSEPVVTMAPPPVSRIIATAARQHKKVPLKLVSTTASQSSSRISGARPRRAMPARWESTSTRPKRVLVAAKRPATDCSLLTSTSTANVSAPVDSKRFADILTIGEHNRRTFREESFRTGFTDTRGGPGPRLPPLSSPCMLLNPTRTNRLAPAHFVPVPRPGQE